MRFYVFIWSFLIVSAQSLSVRVGIELSGKGWHMEDKSKGYRLMAGDCVTRFEGICPLSNKCQFVSWKTQVLSGWRLWLSEWGCSYENTHWRVGFFYNYLDRKYDQVDQGSEMSLILVGMVSHLGVAKRSLVEVGFKGLTMRTADHREPLLYYWALLTTTLSGIRHEVRCFVSPQLTHLARSPQPFPFFPSGLIAPDLVSTIAFVIFNCKWTMFWKVWESPTGNFSLATGSNLDLSRISRARTLSSGCGLWQSYASKWITSLVWIPAY